ncbi:unnamed protein product, partial [Musa textilis]
EVKWGIVLGDRVCVLVGKFSQISPGRLTQADSKFLCLLYNIAISSKTRKLSHCDAVTSPSIRMQV